MGQEVGGYDKVTAIKEVRAILIMIRKLKSIYRRCFWSLEKQARHAGVVMGSGNFIASRFWSSEAYLIKIGSNVALTDGSKIFTHGGGEAHALNILNSTVSGKSASEITFI